MWKIVSVTETAGFNVVVGSTQSEHAAPSRISKRNKTK